MSKGSKNLTYPQFCWSHPHLSWEEFPNPIHIYFLVNGYHYKTDPNKHEKLGV